MATAKKCDICGRLYEVYNTKNDEKNPNGFVYINIDEYQKYFTHHAKDCCPECMDKIKNFVNKLKTE